MGIEEVRKIIVEGVLIATLIGGISAFYSTEIRMFINVIKTKVFFGLSIRGREKNTAEKIDVEKKPHRINDKLRKLIGIAFGIRHKNTAMFFWTAAVLPAFAVFVVLAGRISTTLAFCASGFMAVLPALIIALRLQTLRIKSSKEGEILLTELLDNYKINYFNMQQAIEITAATIEEAPNCKRLLFDLSKGINRAGGSKELKELIDDFRFAVDTSWAGVLADNIYFALTSGIRVSEALGDLLKTVSKAKEVEEMAGRENNESGLILKYLVPACYIMTVFGGIKYFGLSSSEFVKYQFGTEAGLAWFITAAVTYGLALFAKKFLSVRKLDL